MFVKLKKEETIIIFAKKKKVSLILIDNVRVRCPSIIALDFSQFEIVWRIIKNFLEVSLSAYTSTMRVGLNSPQTF